MIRLISCIFAASICAASFAVPMASQPWVTNRIASAIAALPPSGVTTNDVCNIVTNEVEVGWGEWILAIPDELTGEGLEYWRQTVHDATISGHVSIRGNQIWIGEMNATSEQDVSQDGTELRFNGAGWGGLSTYLGLYEGDVIATRTRITLNALGLARLVDLPPLTNGLATASITNGFITDAYIATNNPAFVSAVTNCPVSIAASDAEALAEWGIYGGGGTIGALLAALAAAVAALKKKKMPLYPVGGTGNPVNATYESGVLTVSPFAMASYTPTASAAFSVAMGALPSDMESGNARDAVLVIDCSSLTDGQEPTVTWDTHFHPRTDAGTDFACAAGAKNVYYISEYAPGEFAVGGWTETAGGSGT